MTSYRLALVLAGAVAVTVIAAAAVVADRAVVSAPMFAAMLLVVYALGIGLGRLVWDRRG